MLDGQYRMDKKVIIFVILRKLNLLHAADNYNEYSVYS